MAIKGLELTFTVSGVAKPQMPSTRLGGEAKRQLLPGTVYRRKEIARMKVACFSAQQYERPFFESTAAGGRHSLSWFAPRLDAATALLARGHEAVCAFVNDRLDVAALEGLSREGVKHVALRCAGFNQVDLEAAERLGIRVVRVPAYSPHAVAEHTLALILDLNRKIHRAFARVREGNFSLDGMLGFDLHGRTAGIIGTGTIGMRVAAILSGLRVLAFDPVPNPEASAMGIAYVPLDRLLGEADIVTLHCPLTPETLHLIDGAAVAKMKRGVMLINTSRGKVVDTHAVIEGLKQGRIGYLGLDVYEEEGDLFFRDLSDTVIQDDAFSRLLTFPNVVITGHQAFFTRDAMAAIARTTLQNLDCLESGDPCPNQVFSDKHTRPSA
jgi:D-lactate dehydrogenase